MQIDGKSAYKQRTFAWKDQNKIGFHTIINGQNVLTACLALPFGLHNAGWLFQKPFEQKLNRSASTMYKMVYVDDSSVKIGRVKDRFDTKEWRSAALQHILTRQGEIFNNKFIIYDDRITMLGVNYYPYTDRFTTKMSTFYKLNSKVADLISKPTFTPNNLEKLIGSFLWVLPADQRSFLQPLQFVQKQHCTGKRSKKNTNVQIPVNSQLLDNIYSLLQHCTRQYLLTKTPCLQQRGCPLYIVVDSNPQVTGGYFVLGTEQLMFLPQSKYITQEACEQISNIPEEFLELHKLQKIFNSFRSEGLGLKTLLKKFAYVIQKRRHLFNCIYVMLDNSGLVVQLTKHNAQRTLAFKQHETIYELLDDYNVPYFFRWLPRESLQISKADELGRMFQLMNSNIETSLRDAIEEHFETGKLLSYFCFFVSKHQNISKGYLLYTNKSKT